MTVGPVALAAFVTIAVLLGGCGPRFDSQQADLCEAVLPAIEDSGALPQVVARASLERPAGSIEIRYRLAGGDQLFWLRCRFEGTGFDRDRLVLAAVESERHGALDDISLHFLKRFWLGAFRGGDAVASDSMDIGAQLAYAAQQLINASSLAAVYALLALAYALIHQVIGRFNLAFGEFAMMGAFTAFVAITLANGAGLVLPVVLLLSAVAAGLFGGHVGIAVNATVFAPLARSRSQAPLIATIGLAIAIPEAVRIVTGADEHWVQSVYGDSLRIASLGSFDVTVTARQLLLVGVAIGLIAAVLLGLRGSAFGRAHRAVSDDPGMAALCGIDTAATIRQSFALASALAGIAGFIHLVHYGGIGFASGTMLGFKALVAAIVGGLGSPAGAIAGALFVALLETGWAAYFDIAYREVAVFALLALALVIRPDGLLGPRPPVVGPNG